MEYAAAANVLIVPTGRILPPEELAAFVDREQPDAIIVRLGQLPREAIAASERLRIVAKHGVGFDTIDIQAASELGIPVAVATGANARSVAEHALALMFSVARGIPHLDRRLRSGHWDKLAARGVELRGRTLGLVGAGAIGLQLAELAAALQMKVLAFDPYASRERLGQLQIVPSLAALISASDVISLHCPLTDENRGLIGASEFALMRPDSILINTARGELIEVDALVAALRDGTIFGAGLDTFPVEPAPVDSPLWDLPNVVVTPHVGASTSEAKDRVGMMAISQVRDWFETGAIREGSIVNPDYRSSVAPSRSLKPAPGGSVISDG